MSRRLLSLAAVGLLTAAIGAATALGDGGPNPGTMQGWDGIAANSALRYVAVPAGDWTVLEAISRLDGRVLRYTTVRGNLGIPMVAFDGTAGGLSPDRKTLVLVEAYAGPVLRKTSQFAVVDVKRFRVRANITLQGDFAFDALSPNGRMLYLIEHVSARDLSRYRVRAYDVGARRLLKRMVTDRTRWQSVMQGMPISRATSPDGRWAYTLYNGNRHPFVHALDTMRANAVCIDLPRSWRGLDLFGLRLRVQAGGKLVVWHRTGGRALAVIDTRKLRLLRVVRL
jgi:hypothetical protein